ncbi:uncharacterized protein LOC144493097 [Mustelus asterias]
MTAPLERELDDFTSEEDIGGERSNGLIEVITAGKIHMVCCTEKASVPEKQERDKLPKLFVLRSPGKRQEYDSGTFAQRMDPPTACVPWHSPPHTHSRQNMPSSIDLEQNVIYSNLCTLDELNISKSAKGNAFGTRIQIKEVPIPQLYRKALHNVPSSPVAKGVRTVVVSSARWEACNHRSRSQRCGAASDQQAALSQQVNRLQENQRAIGQCKALKQIAQMVLSKYIIQKEVDDG